MKKNRKRKLKLNRETLKVLDRHELQQAQGGGVCESVRGCIPTIGNCCETL